MSLVQSDEVKALGDMALRFMRDADPAKRLRTARDTNDGAAAARGLWEGFCELGLPGVAIGAEDGGSGLDARASVQVSEMMGRTLAAGPFLASAVMAATAIENSTNDGLRTELLGQIAEGRIFALAAEEAERHDPEALGLTAAPVDGGFVLNGTKLAVISGTIAERLIVVARGAQTGEFALFVVDAESVGVRVQPSTPLDSLPLASIQFSDVFAPKANLLSEGAQARAALERAYDLGRLHLAAEMLGAADEAFERTVAYLKTRVQFGRPIGSFQALQHRAAKAFGALEMARSVLAKAAAEQTPLLISLAKAEIGDTAKLVTIEAVQLHGGIGVTDEFDLGFYVKRVRVAAQMLGDANFHTERYARLSGL